VFSRNALYKFTFYITLHYIMFERAVQPAVLYSPWCCFCSPR